MARGDRAKAARNTNETQRDGRRTRRGAGLRRTIAVAAFLPIASRAPLYARLLWSLLMDARTPSSRKAMLAAALGYVALGRDVVPDRIPLLGQLDDLVVVALATELFLSGLDEDLLEEKLEEAGISRAAYDEDVARIRRLLPGPVRRLTSRIPGGVRLIGEALEGSGIGPRLRGLTGGGGAA